MATTTPGTTIRRCLFSVPHQCQIHLSTSCARQASRHSIAPKVAINIKHIRQNPKLHEQNCLDRNYKSLAENPLKIVKLFDQWKIIQHNSRSLREKNNYLRTKLSHSPTFSGRDIGDQSPSENRQSILNEARQLKQDIEEIEARENDLDTQIEDLAISLPNLTSEKSPVGTTPELIGYINEHLKPVSSSSDHTWRNHIYVGSELDLLDFTPARVSSGWGWYYLKNEAVLLEQALVNYAINVAISHGFKAISPPSVVYSHISSACGFQPRDQNGEQQIYTLTQSQENSNKPSHCLAGTAEIPFAAMKASTELEEADLPYPIVGSSRCYRAEAGSHGLSTKGLYRVHEFTKVEMFSWTLPTTEAVTTLFETMVSIQKQILESLGLHCRILEQPTTDLGASATRKQDIEAFFPSRRERDDGWGELTSTSICTDYQTRRLNTRVRGAAGGKMQFPYTVNGTAVAVPRVLMAIMENGWEEEEECVRIPECLWPWMNGVQIIRKNR